MMGGRVPLDSNANHLAAGKATPVRVALLFPRMGLADDLADAARIHLVARDDARNIRRSYRVERSIDLFGHQIIDWSWGRVGTTGQTRRVSFASYDEARRFVRTLLLRRDTAPKRIGLTYTPLPSSK